jgi:hypothetical protein
VIVFRDVENGEYTRMESVRRGAQIAPSAFQTWPCAWTIFWERAARVCEAGRRKEQ